MTHYSCKTMQLGPRQEFLTVGRGNRSRSGSAAQPQPQPPPPGHALQGDKVLICNNNGVATILQGMKANAWNLPLRPRLGGLVSSVLKIRIQKNTL